MTIDLTAEILHCSIDHKITYVFQENNKYVGKVVCYHVNINEIYIEQIIITKLKRGNKLSTRFWNFVKKNLIALGIDKITLCAKEKYGSEYKLVKLYESWGFEKYGNMTFKYINNSKHQFRYQKMSINLLQSKL